MGLRPAPGTSPRSAGRQLDLRPMFRHAASGRQGTRVVGWTRAIVPNWRVRFPLVSLETKTNTDDLPNDPTSYCRLPTENGSIADQTYPSKLGP